MSIGHPYFGKGKVLETKEDTMVADFGYPWGVKEVENDIVAIIEK